jgi:hypothetical protein
LPAPHHGIATLDQLSYDIDSGFDRTTTIFELVPVADVLVSGLSGQPAEHLPLARGGCGHVVVWRGWYSIGGEDNETVRRMASQDRATTVEEDIHLVESVQRGLKAAGLRSRAAGVDPACGVNSEHSIMHLQRWMREAIDG